MYGAEIHTYPMNRYLQQFQQFMHQGGLIFASYIATILNA